MFGERCTRLLFVWVVLGSCCVCACAGAETITLKSGKVLEGKVTEKKDGKVSVDFYGTTLTFGDDEIATIEATTQTHAQPGIQSEKKSSDQFFVIYDDQDDGNSFVPSGWMGDRGAIKYENNCPTNPHSGEFCQKWIYAAQLPLGNGWAGAYWQNPANNWGEMPGGFDLSKFTKFTFWARGENGGEVVKFLVGGITGKYADTAKVELGKITLTKEWQHYTIDLSGQTLTHIVGGFAWAAERKDNPSGCVFYLDGLRYEK